VGAEKQITEKVAFHHHLLSFSSSSSSYKTLDQHSIQTKAVIELLRAQNITFIIVALFSPFACQLARVALLAVVLRSSNTMPLGYSNK